MDTGHQVYKFKIKFINYSPNKYIALLYSGIQTLFSYIYPTHIDYVP